MRARGGLSAARRGAGFTYIGLLILVALLGIGLALTGQVWHTAATREKERELLFIGTEFQRALAQYAARHANLPDRFPKALEDLVEDRSLNPPQRYLRRIYVDPLTGTTQWGLERNARQGIVAVYSLAAGTPLKQAGFPSRFAEFADATSYAGWKFVARETLEVAAAPANPPPVTGPGNPPDPGTPVPVPPVSPPPKPRARDCAKINQADLFACEEQRARWGSQTVSECQLSAQARLSACIADAPNLPPLYIRHV